MTAPAVKVVGLCHCCDKPVRAGEERRETVHSGTGAGAEVLLHRESCAPDVAVRRTPR